MPSFKNGDVEIAYLDQGEGEPIVLVHGFASTKEVNWVNPGWLGALTRAGRRAIALDNRGHGASSKLYDPAAYHSALMAEDVRVSLKVSVCLRRLPTRSKRHRSPTSPIRPAARSVPSPSRRNPTCVRSPLAFAARARCSRASRSRPSPCP